MVGVVDASSLVAIARYYLPIKDEAILLHFLETKFRAKELLLLSKSIEKRRERKKAYHFR